MGDPMASETHLLGAIEDCLRLKAATREVILRPSDEDLLGLIWFSYV